MAEQTDQPTSPATQVRIVVADDHQIVLHGLESMMRDAADLCIVALCNNYREIESALREHPTDLLLTDLNMPGLNGVDMISAIRKDFPELKIMALTMYFDTRLIKALRTLNVAGYLLKSTAHNELIRAIRTVADGGLLEDPTLNKLVDTAKFQLDEHSEVRDDFIKKYALGKREIEILVEIASGKSSQEIADALHISIETVHSHRKNIKYKAGLKNTAEITAFAIHNGLV